MISEPALLLGAFGAGGLILVLVVAFFVVAPILGLAAWVRVRRLEQSQRPVSGIDLSGLLSRIGTLEQRVIQLERKLEGLAAAPAGPEVRPTPQPEAVPSPTPFPSPPPPPKPTPTAVPSAPPRTLAEALQTPSPTFATKQPQREGFDLENLIAGKWLNRIGILAVLIGVAFFLKYAFDNDWIGEVGRVAIGLLAGAGLLVYSQRLLKRGYGYFSDGIAGLGAGVLYLSLYAGWHFYQVFPPAVAFLAMIAVTGAMIAIAVGRDSQRVALLALAGGFLTPILTSTGQDAQVVLFSYLAVLNAGLIVLARAKQWRFLELPAFFFTQIYFWGWYNQFYHVSRPLLRTSMFSTLFFAQFAAIPIMKSRESGKLFGEQVVLLLANAGMFLIMLHTLLWPDYRWTLTLATLVLAAAHLVVARWVPARETGPPQARLLFAGVALTFATLAIPIRLDEEWLTMAWAIEGAVLMWTGLRARLPYLRGVAFLLFLIVVSRLVLLPIPADRFLLNPRFTAFVVTIACFALSMLLARKKAELSPNEQTLSVILGVMVNVLAVWALSAEVHQLFSDYQADRDSQLAQHLTLTLLWTVYASGLLFWGIKRAVAGLRWQGLALFGLTIGKVFLYDLSLLSGFYRIISSIALGVVLLVVSFIYQKRIAARRAGETE